MKVLDPILTCHPLNDVDLQTEDAYAMYQHIKTPAFVANRCGFVAVHTVDSGGGTTEEKLITLSTSEGMQEVAESEFVRVGKDVLSNTKIAYSKVEGCEGGVLLTSVVCVDPAGSLPDFVKIQIAKQNSEGAERMVKHLMKSKGL